MLKDNEPEKTKILQAVFLKHKARFARSANELSLFAALAQSQCHDSNVVFRHIRPSVSDLLTTLPWKHPDVIQCTIPSEISLDTLATELRGAPILEISFRSINNPDEVIRLIKFKTAVRPTIRKRIHSVWSVLSRLF